MVKQKKGHQNKLKMRGQSLVEFALVLPLLLMLILGAMDIGRMFYYKMALTNAAREGANYLAYKPPSADPKPEDNATREARLYEAIEAEGENFNIDIDVVNEVEILGDCTSTKTCKSGDQVGVKITKEFDLIFSAILQSLGLMSGPITVSSGIYMVVQ